LTEHPKSALERAVELIQWRRDTELSRCVKALFLEEDGTVKTEGQRVLAELRRHSKLFNSSITRDRQGRIDGDEMLRLEGRREIVLRLINLLELDPLRVARFVEVDNGQT
jgi:hypothetical protein